MSQDSERDCSRRQVARAGDDPYGWLEDVDSAETSRYVVDQNQRSIGFLEVEGSRDRIRDRIRELLDFERWSHPIKRGGRYFMTRNSGLENHGPYYWMDSLDDDPQLLIDPKTLQTEEPVSPIGYVPSEDGERVAYGTCRSGSDWQEWWVREVKTRRDLDDRIQWAKFTSPVWTHDSLGFYYCRFDEPQPGETYTATNQRQQVRYHKIGTDQSEDVLVYQRPDEPRWIYWCQVTEDGRYLLLVTVDGTRRERGLFYKDLRAEDALVVELLSDFDAFYEPVGTDGSIFYIWTDHEAPLGRVIAIDVDDPAPSRREVIPEAADAIQSVSLVGDHFVVTYLQDAHSRVRTFDTRGRFIRDVDLPDLGSANGFMGRRSDPETFYSFCTFTTPNTIYRYDVTTGASTALLRPRQTFDPRGVDTQQVFYESADGTRVPMFIVSRTGVPRDGSNPVYLTGYGGYGTSETPYFSLFGAAWLELGGIFALANLRGGGEYGKAWHEAGHLDRKQNTFDDFIAAAQWLIDNGYTRPSRLAVAGRSNGGLLVGAVMTQRPELFGACLPAYGVFDMLRFHKYGAGPYWIREYGDPDDSAARHVLLAYSPYHNVRSHTRYPATLITTGDHDDRVFPGHSLKFAAALQDAQAGPAPILLRVYPNIGHGFATPVDRAVEEVADEVTFAARVLGVLQAESGQLEGS